MDTFEKHAAGFAVTFSGRAGRYPIADAPEDLVITLRSALASGRAVEVTYDEAAGCIVEAITRGEAEQ